MNGTTLTMSTKDVLFNDHKNVKKMLLDHSQDHILNYWDNLHEKQKQMLYDVNVPQLLHSLKAALNGNSNSPVQLIDESMEPVEENCFGSVPCSNSETIQSWRDVGLEEISKGRVAAILLAGGQGSRLGVKYPKGMYDVGLPSKKTLYQLQAERILRLQQIARTVFPSEKECVIPWYIMTSDSTKEQTLKFFKDNNYFGLDEQNVIIFEQFTLPCIDFNCKLMMEDEGKLTSAPDGNGGLYKALKKCNMLNDMRNRGVKCTHVYCVDNILVKMADPVFIGFCIEKNAECAAKAVKKVKPDEAVGVVCKVDGVYQVVEYSEISKATSEKRDANGKQLMFSAANICNHYFTTEFLEKVCSPELEQKLQYHIAKKKIVHIEDENPSKPNGYKLEKFVFDVFKFAEKFAVLEVSRDDEFSPLKRADEPSNIGGESNPRTSRYALMYLHHRQIIAAGGSILDNDGNICEPQPSGTKEYPIECEISPLISYFGEDLERFVKGLALPTPYIIK